MTGAEAANLQGIDFEQVIVTNITESLLQDWGDYPVVVVVLALIKERPAPSPEEATQDSAEIPAGEIPTQATLVIMPPESCEIVEERHREVRARTP